MTTAAAIHAHEGTEKPVVSTVPVFGVSGVVEVTVPVFGAPDVSPVFGVCGVSVALAPVFAALAPEAGPDARVAIVARGLGETDVRAVEAPSTTGAPGEKVFEGVTANAVPPGMIAAGALALVMKPAGAPLLSESALLPLPEEPDEPELPPPPPEEPPEEAPLIVNCVSVSVLLGVPEAFVTTRVQDAYVPAPKAFSVIVLEDVAVVDVAAVEHPPPIAIVPACVLLKVKGGVGFVPEGTGVTSAMTGALCAIVKVVEAVEVADPFVAWTLKI